MCYHSTSVSVTYLSLTILEIVRISSVINEFVNANTIFPVSSGGTLSRLHQSKSNFRTRVQRVHEIIQPCGTFEFESTIIAYESFTVTVVSIGANNSVVALISIDMKSSSRILVNQFGNKTVNMSKDRASVMNRSSTKDVCDEAIALYSLDRNSSIDSQFHN